MEEVVVRRREWDCGSPLYDSFELASLYGLLDSNLMALPFAKRSATAERAPARRIAAAKATAKEQRRRKKATAAAPARRTGKAVLRSIFRQKLNT
uniref:Uncharacterized protein n=1 Tax=Oryza punctata TaxID=4537 RepID=A0A0E0L5Z3_ORYPU